MAWEYPVCIIPGLEASSDLSSNQFYIVKMSTTNLRVSLASVAGEPCLGVLQNDPSAAGAAAEVMALGVSKVIANETLTAGDFWGAAANGKAQVIQHSITGADTRAYVMGTVLEGAAAGGLATVSVGFPTFQVSV